MILRVIFFAPMMVSPVMVAFLWKYVYNPAPDAGLKRGPGRDRAPARCGRTGWAIRRSRSGRSRSR